METSIRGFVTEDSHCNPLGIYGALKLSGEFMVKAYNNVFDLPYTIVRPSAYTRESVLAEELARYL